MKRLETYFYDTLEEHKIMYKDAQLRPRLDFAFDDGFAIPEVQLNNIITSPYRSPHPAFRFVAPRFPMILSLMHVEFI